jgi:hypothetical protein
MKWRLFKAANGIWTVLFPCANGYLHGFGFQSWQDAANYLLEDTQ